ncbi:MAG: GNAT family N-acetyltransferase [Candidatus Aminicenantes bacterium]|nr:GNAT family N-acetyltransferase [Candidatus Aminicenantes bacterium]
MIRRMHASDKNKILEILHATDMFTGKELQVASEQIDIYLNNANQTDYSLVVIENDSADVIGFMSYGQVPLTDGAYDLYWIAVSPKAQGCGYGKELVLWLEKQIIRDSGRMILIETSSQPKYESTRAFYRALDYKEAFRIPDYYKNGDDLISYIKFLTPKNSVQDTGLATLLKTEV